MARDKHRRSSSLSPDRREKRRRRSRGGPPRYEDLGKQADDVFGSGYLFGLLIKLDVGFRTKVSDLQSLLIRSRLRQQPELSFPLDAALTSSLARCPDTWRPSTRWRTSEWPWPRNGPSTTNSAPHWMWWTNSSPAPRYPSTPSSLPELEPRQAITEQ